MEGDLTFGSLRSVFSSTCTWKLVRDCTAHSLTCCWSTHTRTRTRQCSCQLKSSRRLDIIRRIGVHSPNGPRGTVDCDSVRPRATWQIICPGRWTSSSGSCTTVGANGDSFAGLSRFARMRSTGWRNTPSPPRNDASNALVRATSTTHWPSRPTRTSRRRSRAWAQCVARSVRVIVLVNMCNFSATLLHECWKIGRVDSPISPVSPCPQKVHLGCRKGALLLQTGCIKGKMFIIGISPSEMPLFWTRGWPKNHEGLRWVFQIWIGDTRQTGCNNSVTPALLKKENPARDTPRRFFGQASVQKSCISEGG